MTRPTPPVPEAWWDHFELPDGYRAEVIRGELVVTPAPNNSHQYAVSRLAMALWVAVEAALPPELVVLPGAEWRLAESGLVAQAPQPDVVVLVREEAHRQDVAPVLAIEVLSPSDASRLGDGLTRIEGKRADYARHGLVDYLEIEPESDGFLARRYELVDDRFVVADVVPAGGVLVADRPFPYEIRLADLVL